MRLTGRPLSGSVLLALPFVALNVALVGIFARLTDASVAPALLATFVALLSLIDVTAWAVLRSRRAEEHEVAATRAGFLKKLDGRRNAINDETTGLYTPWYFERRLKQEAARCRRYSHSMAVVVLRVDQVNLTTFSTDGWQKRAQTAAGLAAEVVREVDIAAALSPFELALCLVHCDRQGAYRAIARVAERLDGYVCEAGVTVFPEEALEPAALIAVARTRLAPVHLVGTSGWPMKTEEAKSA